MYVILPQCNTTVKYPLRNIKSITQMRRLSFMS